jgi:hypothetical protein
VLGSLPSLSRSLAFVGARAIVLAGDLLNSLVRNIEIRGERLVSRYQQKANKTDGWSELLLVFSMRRENFPEKIRNQTNGLRYCYYCSFFRGAPGR